MKRKIRWLKTFKQPVLLGTPSWQNPSDTPPSGDIKTGWRFFQNGSELEVYVYGTDPVIISKPGLGITEGDHFEFVD